MNDQPIIAIYRDDMRYRVEIEGKEIERLKAFGVRLKANPEPGTHEMPHCEIEQFLPYPIRKKAEIDPR